MASNFAFLRGKFSELAELGALAERYRRSDTHSCLMKLGLLCEGMARIMVAADKIAVPERCDAAERLDILQRRGVMPSDVAAAFHLIRKARNRAAHEGLQASPHKTLYFLQITYSLCEWFFQTYGDEDHRHRDFVEPEDLGPSPVGAGAEETGERLEQAAARASQSAAVAEDTRRARAEKAARQRHVSEAETRCLIDEQLRKVGWEADSETLRHARGARPRAGRNMAIAEWPTDSSTGSRGFADYALFIGVRLVGLIEAKAQYKDIPSVLDQQCRDYARHIRREDNEFLVGEWRGHRVPFLFAANGRPYLRQWEEKSGIWFQDVREAANPPQALRGWMSPDGMEALLNRNTAEDDRRLAAMPVDFLADKDGLNLRPYQLRAVRAAEEAVVGGAQSVLLAMATGTGKTRTVLGMMYRFLKSGRFRRILFLVDRNALGTQALDVFTDVKLEDRLPLDKIYNIRKLGDRDIEGETRVHIATVQAMVKRILYGEDSDSMPSVTDYDLVIVDEAHRGYILDREMTDAEALYRDQRDYQSKYRQVIDYFQAVKVGLTATPAAHTTRIFGPPVFSYLYREAVIDGYLVDQDPPHQLGTKLGEEGIHYKPGDIVATYDPVTGVLNNAEQLEDELDFDIDNFNKTVVNEHFNREILKEIARDIDPEDGGKTLIYAVNDQHADMIVRILKELYAPYGVDGEAVMKITAAAGQGDRKKIDALIRRFKNEAFPSLAVTVDLLTTGIDVPEITRLVFLRRVKSRILFEQMMGRATRLCPEIGKDHFDVYDAVGVYGALEPVSGMKPVAVDPATTFLQLLDGLERMEETPHILNQVHQIMAKLQRRKRSMTEEIMRHFVDMVGETPDAFIERLQNLRPAEAGELLLSQREAFRLIEEEGHVGSAPIVLSDTPDELIYHTRGYGKGQQRPDDYLESFARFVRENRDRMAALAIICTRPADLTRESLRSLRLALGREGFTARQLSSAVSTMSSGDIMADIIGFVRRYGADARLLGHEERIRNAVERLKKAHRFTKMEEKWLDRIAKYLLHESVLSVRTFDESVTFREAGGFARLDKVFQHQLEHLVHELNTYLYDDGGLAA